MRRILQHLGRYRRDSIICILMTALEVVMEVLLPFITARIIDDGLSESNMPVVYRYGIIMIIMAFLSLLFRSWRENLLPARRRGSLRI